MPIPDLSRNDSSLTISKGLEVLALAGMMQKSQIVLMLVLVMAGMGCRKTGSPAGGSAPGGCRLVNEYQSDTIQRITKYTYAYDIKGNLDSIYTYDYFNNLVNYEVIKSTQVVSTAGAPNQFIQLDYTGGDLFDAQNPPAGMSITLIDGSPLDTNISLFAYGYDANRKLATIDLSRHYESPNPLMTETYTYNSDGNLTAITVANFETSDSIPRTDALEYDSHPTPYANIPNWPFIKPDFDPFESEDRESSFVILSKNNPLGYTGVFAPNALQLVPITDKVTYSYNDEGFPIIKTSTFDYGDGGRHVAITHYTYECK